MPRLAVVLLGIGLLAACSAGGSHPQSDPSASQSGEGSLEGVTSEYSIRLSEMPNYENLDSDSAMKDGLIAGDEAVHVAAAAFRQGEYYALDLIVNNRGALPMSVERDDVRLVDSAGQWMTPVQDFSRADELGIRGRTSRQTSTMPFDGLGLYDNGAYGDPVSYTSNNLAGKSSSSTPVVPDDRANSTNLMDLAPNSIAPQAPAVLDVPGGRGEPGGPIGRPRIRLSSR